MNIKFETGITTSLYLSDAESRAKLQEAIDREYPIFVYGARPLYAHLIQQGIKLQKPFFDVELASLITRSKDGKAISKDEFNQLDFASQFIVAKELKAFMVQSGSVQEFNRRSRFDLIVSELQENGVPCDKRVFEKSMGASPDHTSLSILKGYRDSRLYSTFATGAKGAGRLTTEGPPILSMPKAVRKAIGSEGMTQVIGDWNSFHYSILAERTRCLELAKLMDLNTDIPSNTYKKVPALSQCGPISKLHRKLTKRLLNAILNGGQASALEKTLQEFPKDGISAEEVFQGIVKLYPGIELLQNELRSVESASSVLGRRLEFSQMRLGQKMALYLQASEVELLQEAAWRFRGAIRQIPGANITLLWHDAIYAEVPHPHASKVAGCLYDAMVCTPRDLGFSTAFNAKVMTGSTWDEDDCSNFELFPPL